MKHGNSVFRITVIIYLAAMLAVMAGQASAQEQPSGNKSVVSFGANTSDEAKPAVTDAASLTNQNNKQLRIRDTIAVTVKNLKGFIAEKVNNDKKKITLFLNGRGLYGIAPLSLETENGKVLFPLEITEDTKDTWNYLLSHSTNGNLPLDVTIGDDKGEVIPTDVKEPPRLVVITGNERGAYIIGMLLFLAVFLGLAIPLHTLRDSYPDMPASANTTYSLALCQMAWWFVIITASYVYLCIIHQDFGTAFSKTALILMGISSTTALGARITDESSKKRRSFSHENFFKDILTDDDDRISLHRFQIFVWTIALGFFYIIKVFTTSAMPELDNSLLALMGISSGTYLGFKFPENNPKNADPGNK